MPYAIQIKNDYCEEIWGPYDTKQEAQEVKDAFVGVPESATIHYIGNPESLDFDGKPL